MKFKPEDFKSCRRSGYEHDFFQDEAARCANARLAEMLEEDCRKANRLSSWPITRERYRQIKAKMRRMWNRIQELEEALGIVSNQDRTRGYPTGSEWIKISNMVSTTLKGIKKESEHSCSSPDCKGYNGKM